MIRMLGDQPRVIHSGLSMLLGIRPSTHPDELFESLGVDSIHKACLLDETRCRPILHLRKNLPIPAASHRLIDIDHHRELASIRGAERNVCGD